MGVVAEAEEALNNYIHNGIMPVLPDTASSNDAGVWQCVFENYHEAWCDLTLQEARRHVAFSIGNYQSEPSKSLLELIGMTAHAYSRLYTPVGNSGSPVYHLLPELHKQIVDIWIDGFDKIGLRKEFIESWYKALEICNRDVWMFDLLEDYR